MVQVMIQQWSGNVQDQVMVPTMDQDRAQVVDRASDQDQVVAQVVAPTMVQVQVMDQVVDQDQAQVSTMDQVVVPTMAQVMDQVTASDSGQVMDQVTASDSGQVMDQAQDSEADSAQDSAQDSEADSVMDSAPTITMGQAQASVQVMDKIMELLPHQSVNQVHQPQLKAHHLPIQQLYSNKQIQEIISNSHYSMDY
ncbi:conserved hypothetical protein [Candida albicans WO-1]|uniref:Uncharacterized protein n=1 Tax=Candida albicans (strain WO-1) TaxID=294748 RepID=C4YKI8_CANAW|nr:conserved hypothetical protein [Candida albicans WO-1]